MEQIEIVDLEPGGAKPAKLAVQAQRAKHQRRKIGQQARRGLAQRHDRNVDNLGEGGQPRRRYLMSARQHQHRRRPIAEQFGLARGRHHGPGHRDRAVDDH